MRVLALAVLAILLVGAPVAADRPGPARIVDIQLQGGDSLIAINRGADQGIAAGWRGRLVTPDGKSVPHGDFIVIRVTRKTCTGKVPLTPDEISRGDYRADLEPP